MELNALLPQQHVACGGAARTLDVKKLTEAWKRGRVETEAESGSMASCAPLRRWSFRGRQGRCRGRRQAPRDAPPCHREPRRSPVATAALCWEYLPALLKLGSQTPRPFARLWRTMLIASCLAMSRHKHRAGAARVSSR